MVPTILIAGTWGLDGDTWWQPESPFWQEGERQGVTFLGHDDSFKWTTAVDGLIGKNTQWIIGGTSLKWYVEKQHHEGKHLRQVSVVAHSHGGQVALYAAALGLKINTLITVATPVRKDMESVIQRGRDNIRQWIHIRSNQADWWQWLGELRDGRVGIYRDMPQADHNILEPDTSHSNLLRPQLWTARGWWRWLRET